MTVPVICAFLALLAGPQEPWSGPLQSVTVQYALGPSLHQATLRDSEPLQQCSSDLRIVGVAADAALPERGRILGRFPALLLDFGENGRHTVRITGRNQVQHPGAGRLTLAPAFFADLERWLSAVEGCPVRLGVENPFPSQRLERLRQFQNLGATPWNRARLIGPDGQLSVHDSALLENLFLAFDGLYVPGEAVAGSSWGHRVQLASYIGQGFELELLDGTKAVTQPLHSVLVRHSEFGLCWVGEGFRDAWLDLYLGPDPFAAVPAEEWREIREQSLGTLAALASAPEQAWQVRCPEPVQAGEPWKHHLLLLPSKALAGDWCAHWAVAEPYALQPDPPGAIGRWAGLAPNLHRVSWVDREGRRQTLVGDGLGFQALLPTAGLTLAGDPWAELWAAVRETLGDSLNPEGLAPRKQEVAAPR
ncbi:MAG: hypothetical protein R3F17_09315 [Planctomycetota bacterium]